MNLKAITLSTLALLPAGILAACGSNASTSASTNGSGNTGAATAQGAPQGMPPGTDGTTTGTTPQGAPATGTTPQGAPGAGGDVPRGAPPAGFGTPATGSAATKASAAATAKYPGTVERVMKLQDGSYVVHVVTGSGEQHVKVSAAFKVTGLDTSMPGPPNGAPQGAPQGNTPS